MGKKTTRSTYTSKGERKNISTVNKKLVKRSLVDKELDIIKAWRKGSNPWVTIPNPNKSETAKRQIRVRANVHYGDPKGRRREDEK